jgi:hypothetical protein
MYMNILFSLAGFDEIFRLFLQTQQTTPDTSRYMIAGFVVIFGTMLVYLISLVIRWRNLRGDLDVLHELDKRPPVSSASQAENKPLEQLKG